ncbi:Clp protease N-terminal domain-containing protein [Citrobacter sp. 172116965]|uniref:Clp protease N-terminal domain-containing protein n=1 Tax=Citrobacter TaxID=544 RepID=UPI0015DD2454|nr:Clp protease N-terminal domain-containing protein [Citrobacter sp. 172116965]QLK36569.1 hypothetical protein GPJ68_02975 [Citrobacter sp. 172116965]
MDLKALVKRLNPICFRALEQAAERSRAQGHWFVEPEHMLLALLDDEHCDLAYCLSNAAISTDTLREEIQRAQAQFKAGCTRMPVFSVQLIELLEGAILQATFQRIPLVRSALLLLTLLTRERLRTQLAQGMPLLLQLPAAELESQWQTWCRNSVEEAADPDKGESPKREGGVLDQYTHDLTRDAREGRIDPIIGRDALMNPLMILVKIIKLRWIHILSYDQMVSRKINNQTTRCANSIFYTTLFTNSAPNYT